MHLTRLYPRVRLDATDVAAVGRAGGVLLTRTADLTGLSVALRDAWVRADPSVLGSVVHERLVAEYGFTGSYQRVKMFLAEARPRIVAELAITDENLLTGLHRRFETIAGARPHPHPHSGHSSPGT